MSSLSKVLRLAPFLCVTAAVGVGFQRTRTALGIGSDPDEPGIRIYDTADDSPLNEEPLDVGLPLFMVCFTR